MTSPQRRARGIAMRTIASATPAASRASAPTRTRRDALFAAAFVVGAPRARASVETDLREKTFSENRLHRLSSRGDALPGLARGRVASEKRIRGYEFPSASASEETIAREPSTPGFQKIEPGVSPGRRAQGDA